MTDQRVRGVRNVMALPHILEVLESYGLSQEELEKIAWGNFARVIRERLGQ